MNSMKHRLSANQRRLINRELKLQVSEITEENFSNTIATFLYTLHLYSGWGKKRLRDFYTEFDKLHAELLEWYKLPNTDDGWLCKKKLKDIGVDIDEWIREDTIRAEKAQTVGGSE